MVTFKGKRLVKKFNQIKICNVGITELAMTNTLDYIYEGKELCWIERGEDEYGIPHYKDKVAVILHRNDWLNGEDYM